MSTNAANTDRLLQEAGRGDREALGDLLERYRSRLHRMVELRLHPRLRSRLDASDVLQEAFLLAARRLPEYLEDPRAPFFLWLRFLVGQKLVDLHRLHLGAKRRDARQELRFCDGGIPGATSEVIAARLMGNYTAPTRAARRAEMKLRLQEALNTMDPLDREIVTLRHFEQLGNAEAAQELGISSSAAGKRYVKALKRLKRMLQRLGEDLA